MAERLLCRARAVQSGGGPCPSRSILSEVNHQLESRMREIRLSGSEGGGAEFNRLSLTPIQALFFMCPSPAAQRRQEFSYGQSKCFVRSLLFRAGLENDRHGRTGFVFEVWFVAGFFAAGALVLMLDGLT